MQRFINTALDSYWFWLLARLCLMVIFISSGLAKLFDIEGSLAEMRAAGFCIRPGCSTWRRRRCC